MGLDQELVNYLLVPPDCISVLFSVDGYGVVAGRR